MAATRVDKGWEIDETSAAGIKTARRLVSMRTNPLIGLTYLV